MRLSPLGTSATIWLIVSAPDDGWWLVCSNRWNDCQGKPNYAKKTCPSATSSITNITWPDSGSNLGRRGGKPATTAGATARPSTLLSTIFLFGWQRVTQDDLNGLHSSRYKQRHCQGTYHPSVDWQFVPIFTLTYTHETITVCRIPGQWQCLNITVTKIWLLQHFLKLHGANTQRKGTPGSKIHC
jgi:hypothetical protein